MYLYRTSVYKNVSEIVDPPPDNAAKLTDWLTHIATAKKVDNILIMETTYIINEDYNVFKLHIDGTIITWANVRYMETATGYIIFFITDILF